jgi:Kef-type K+ transport system membrane component KefB
VFAEVAALLILAAACGYVARWLRQPLVVAFVVVGILVGPAALNWVRSASQVDLLAKMGLTLLLFLVGLKLDVHVIRNMGAVAMVTGLGQVVFTAFAGYLIAVGLGMTPVTALYVAVALTFSSTVIIVKLLSDKREIDALHGRIALGILIVQDLVVVLVMIVLAAFGAGDHGELSGRGIAAVVGWGVAFLVGVALLMRFVLPRLLDHLASSQELLILFAIAWGVALGALGDYLGFGREVGAFVAGVALASTRYREAIGSRLVSLRDFLLLFFFVSLGAQQDIGLLDAQIGPAIVLSLFVLIGNPLIVMVLMGVMGYRKRTGFLTGLTVAQISEFSFILASFGKDLGHIDAEALGLVTLVGLVTIALSTYLILYSHVLYEWLAPWLGIFERRIPHLEEALDRASPTPRSVDMIVFGVGRYGSRLVRGLQDRGVSVLAVDFDPEAVTRCRHLGIASHYGDAEDPEFPGELPLRQARWVVSTARGRDANLALLDALRHHGYAGRVALTAYTFSDQDALQRSGADLVLLPYADAAERGIELLTEPGSADRARAREVAPDDMPGEPSAWSPDSPA